jgi:hypothetical protein
MQRTAKPLFWIVLYLLTALPASLHAQQFSSNSTPFVVPAAWNRRGILEARL